MAAQHVFQGGDGRLSNRWVLPSRVERGTSSSGSMGVSKFTRVRYQGCSEAVFAGSGEAVGAGAAVAALSGLGEAAGPPVGMTWAAVARGNRAQVISTPAAKPSTRPGSQAGRVNLLARWRYLPGIGVPPFSFGDKTGQRDKL